MGNTCQQCCAGPRASKKNPKDELYDSLVAEAKMYEQKMKGLQKRVVRHVRFASPDPSTLLSQIRQMQDMSVDQQDWPNLLYGTAKQTKALKNIGEDNAQSDEEIFSTSPDLDEDRQSETARSQLSNGTAKPPRAPEYIDDDALISDLEIFDISPDSDENQIVVTCPSSDEQGDEESQAARF